MSKLAIFLYHGINDTPTSGIENFSGKHLHVLKFRQQMILAKKIGTPLSMDAVVEHVRYRKPFPKNAFAVTFDDGFENNFSVAAPILDELKIPATFYFSTGFVGTEKMFWVDEIEDCINRAKVPNILLSLPHLNLPTPMPIRTNEEKIHAITTIKVVCKESAVAVKNQILRALRSATKITPEVGEVANYKKISWQQVRELDQSRLYHVGGHSHWHDILSRLPFGEMERDITLCRKHLETTLGRKMVHFSYPEGRSIDYNRAVISHLREHDVICSPSAVSGSNHEYSDLFHLKREMIGFAGTPFPWDESN